MGDKTFKLRSQCSLKLEKVHDFLSWRETILSGGSRVLINLEIKLFKLFAI
jgi:hypothetical protein